MQTDTTLFGAIQNKQLTPETVNHLCRHFGCTPRSEFKVVAVARHEMEIMTLGKPTSNLSWEHAIGRYGDPDSSVPPGAVHARTYRVQFQRFMQRGGRVLFFAYLPETDTVYLRQGVAADYPAHKRYGAEPHPAEAGVGLQQWFKTQQRHILQNRPDRIHNEGLLEWGDRLIRLGYMDNPEWRWKYQSALMSAPIDSLTGLIRKARGN